MSLEGALRVGLRLKAGRIDEVRIASSRPDVAQALLQRRTRAEVQAAVPLLFSICARSQATACALACAAAAGEPLQPAALEDARAEVAAEMVRESAWQTLLQWPRWMGEEPDTAAIRATRAAIAYRCDRSDRSDRSPDDAQAREIAQAVFGCAADEWLKLDHWPALQAWASAGRSAAARLVHKLEEACADHATAPTPFLPAPAADWLRTLAIAAFDEPGFTQRPVCQGQVAQTGAWTRQHRASLVGTAGPDAPPLLARQLARLRELALLLAGQWGPAVGTLVLGPGCALAWVDNARGLLIHLVQLDGQRVQRLRIVAPTEWNFHPEGALARELRGAPAADAASARQRATRLINSLDPCVACHVEINDDA